MIDVMEIGWVWGKYGIIKWKYLLERNISVIRDIYLGEKKDE